MIPFCSAIENTLILDPTAQKPMIFHVGLKLLNCNMQNISRKQSKVLIKSLQLFTMAEVSIDDSVSRSPTAADKSDLPAWLVRSMQGHATAVTA